MSPPLSSPTLTTAARETNIRRDPSQYFALATHACRVLFPLVTRVLDDFPPGHVTKFPKIPLKPLRKRE